MKKPVVALVGRPNVGKSTLFNKLVGKKVSIIEDTPGITRDRIYGNVKYGDYNFHLIDTGGIDLSEMDFNDDIKVQAELAIDEADVVLFVVDGKEGLTSNDYTVKEMLKKFKLIFILDPITWSQPFHLTYSLYPYLTETWFPTNTPLPCIPVKWRMLFLSVSCPPER